MTEHDDREAFARRNIAKLQVATRPRKFARNVVEDNCMLSHGTEPVRVTVTMQGTVRARPKTGQKPWRVK